MYELVYTVSPDGLVSANGSEVQSQIDELKIRLINSLKPFEGMMVQHLVSMYRDIEAMEYGYLTETGWKSLCAEFNEAEELVGEIDGCVAITDVAFKRLQDQLAEEQKKDPTLTIEDLLSKIILAIPMPG